MGGRKKSKTNADTAEPDPRGDFLGFGGRVRELQEKYSPKGENLHFNVIARPDAALFSELLELARLGLSLVHKHRAFYLQNPLYEAGCQFRKI